MEQKTGESSFELLLQQFEDDAEVKKEKKSGTKKENKKQAKNKKSKKANVKKEVLKEILCENCGVTEENCQVGHIQYNLHHNIVDTLDVT